MKIGRENYVSFDDNDDMWILNPKWNITPSTLFVKKTFQLIMTCREHNGDNPELMLHQFRQP